MSKKKQGLTMIEILITVSILALLMTIGLFTYRTQLAKGRDAKRKADLNELQNSLEDYLNDNLCYPDTLTCDTDFAPYLQKVPCDPQNNSDYNYFYSYDESETCKTWYKIYCRLENTEDPVIEKKGCLTGCGPADNYNYWVSSANVAE